MTIKVKKAPVESPLVRSYRELLGVSPNVTEEELKKAYRKLVSLYHPDRNPDPASAKQFIKITEAYDILSEPARLQRLNQTYLEKRLYDFPFAGINISFGSFFGYRRFNLKRIKRELRLGTERAGEADADLGIFDLSYSDTNLSILDNPAFDSIELVYAGKFSIEDDQRVLGGVRGRELGQLPWVVLNNRGIINFLEEKFSEALDCYEELNTRVPKNIIFLYRLGLCHAIVGFQRPVRNIFGVKKPDPTHLNKAIECLRNAISVAETRSIGKQKCFTIRKTLADIYEKLGKWRLARQVWQEVRTLDPQSAEAAYRLRSAFSRNIALKSQLKLRAKK